MLPEKLREARKNKNLTQQEVANYLGMTRQNYTAYEGARSVPDANQLKVLADFFGVTTDYFFGGISPDLEAAQNSEEQRLLLLARRAAKIPTPQLDKLIANFEANIDLFLDAIEDKN